jgi:hypothetical protein
MKVNGLSNLCRKPSKNGPWNTSDCVGEFVEQFGPTEWKFKPRIFNGYVSKTGIMTVDNIGTRRINWTMWNLKDLVIHF